MSELSILYQDEFFVAINKPANLLVHKSELSTERVSALSILRDQIGFKVYPVHRLDRATSGVLVFGTSPEALKLLSQEFEHKKINKFYHAIVRGYANNSDTIDYPLKKEDTDVLQDAITNYELVDKLELPFPSGKFNTSRYSLVKINPITGRRHQIRRHFHHISHHIIGDTTYGDGKHNRLFREKLELSRLLLHASELSFIHPFTKNKVLIECELPEDFVTLNKYLVT